MASKANSSSSGGKVGSTRLTRTGQSFDGWFPISATPELFASGLAQVRSAAEAAGRDPRELSIAVYLNASIDDDADKALAEQREYMEAYYGTPFEVQRRIQGCCAGSAEVVRNWIAEYIAAGAEHIVIRPTTRGYATQLERLHTLVTAARPAQPHPKP